MVNFSKRLAGGKAKKVVDPIALYETLDRATDKGPLRPAQIAVLKAWFDGHQTDRDIIVKLHTGQGKTLIGLLMLQSRLNDGKGPVVYLCPSNFLVEQTCDQAKQFGIKTCIAAPELPEEFLHGDSILVTSVQKLFNGLTKFGLNNQSVSIGTLLMDDAHACVDAIRAACRIRIPRDEPAYHSILEMFSTDLEEQGVGTFADIQNQKRDALLPIPYWAWTAKEAEVARILSSATDRQSVRYAWPLLKNMLDRCQCVISGDALEIEPYVAPLQAFGSYWRASHRILMSATVTDDSFLVKGLQLSPKTIASPLKYAAETWSGEKMVLIPSLIDESLDRSEMVNMFAKPNDKRRSGVVALTNSFATTKDWEAYGAIVADTKNIPTVVGSLKRGQYELTVVLANRYDGIDLPDDTCRILIFDGKPFSESLIDLHTESCRPNSEATLIRAVRSVEQGMGRSVRGEKDYSVVVVTGTDLTRLIRDSKSRSYFSPQVAQQVKIGIDVAEMAREEVGDEGAPVDAFAKLISQCLNRDPDWKEYYAEQMDSVVPNVTRKEILEQFEMELLSEHSFASGNYRAAVDRVQAYLDKNVSDSDEKGWYLQEMARYSHKFDRPLSERFQLAAHSANRLLLKPANGVQITKLSIVSHGRMERIQSWISQFDDYSQLNVALTDILARLAFGVKADKFEQALDELASCIGFVGERPDKEWKEGPDNLWALDGTQYILWECKDEVLLERSEINKRESEQMNRSAAWFEKHYPGMKVKRLMIHPAQQLESAGAFTHEVEVVRPAELKRLVKAVRTFFNAFEHVNFSDLSAHHIQKLVDSHGLALSEVVGNYSKKIRDNR
ncbi:DEAD/DEAH box helicase [Massilia varians]|uniref:DEAD/DEAH box helicase n=1 Tax=Massilia varians TaxID=457921 RepID=A0ABN6T425_9BURK|nr:DEAD/DEAH box helicase family protein [Massilia varians]BDT57039.1 DEAD/DEAH box helicase [Massilia varians]